MYKPADQIDLDFINHKTQLALQTIKQTLLKIFQTFETDVSDYHQLISKILKPSRLKGPLHKKILGSYKTFDTESFNTTLQASLDTVNSNTYIKFEKAFLNVLNKHAPVKTKILRHNNNAFMTK